MSPVIGLSAAVATFALVSPVIAQLIGSNPIVTVGAPAGFTNAVADGATYIEITNHLDLRDFANQLPLTPSPTTQAIYVRVLAYIACSFARCCVPTEHMCFTQNRCSRTHIGAVPPVERQHGAMAAQSSQCSCQARHESSTTAYVACFSTHKYMRHGHWGLPESAFGHSPATIVAISRGDLQGNCQSPPPQVMGGPPLGDIPTGTCLIQTAKTVLEWPASSFGSRTIWLDQLHFRLDRAGGTEDAFILNFSPNDTNGNVNSVFWLTNSTLQGDTNPGSNALSVGGGEALVQGALRFNGIALIACCKPFSAVSSTGDDIQIDDAQSTPITCLRDSLWSQQ